jgi:glycosyltransferase involved in cell wall biosynthesis
MKCLIDARGIHPAMGGIGQMSVHLLRELGAYVRGHHLTSIIGSACTGNLRIEGVDFIQVDAAMIDESFEQLGLPALLENLQPDIYLNTAFSIPALKTCRRQIGVIHDVVFEDHPEWVELGLRTYLQKWSRFAAQHADRVVTVSKHAQQRISQVYGIPLERIAVIPNGIAEDSFIWPSSVEIRRVKQRYGLDLPYLVYLGTVEPKKGTPELLTSFAQLVQNGFAGRLVLAGGRSGPAYDLEADVTRLGLSGRVRHLGYVDEADKKPLISGAQLMVYPSRYEGFGLPPLEALALGVPCVASRETSIPEVVGDHALLVDPTDTMAFAAALARGLSDEHFRSRSRQQGPGWARRFSWKIAANAYLDLCESLVSS